jgi:phage gp37-like protein
MAALLTQIEQAMVAKLALALPGLQVESYAGQLDDEHTEWLRVLPCAWVTFETTTKVRRIGRRRVQKGVRFQVLVAQRMLGPEPAARLGGFGQKGLYDLVENDVQGALIDQTLGLPIDSLAPAATRMVVQGYFGNDAAAVISIGFTTGFIETLTDPTAQAPGDLNTVGLAYELQPGDDQADAADVVTLATPT